MLSGGDLRSIGRNRALISKVKGKKDFDCLIDILFSGNRLQVMRAADLIEKITVTEPRYLRGHESGIVHLIEDADDKELKWHLAQLVTRIPLDRESIKRVWYILKKWATDTKESRIVRVESVEALWRLVAGNAARKREFNQIVQSVISEAIPSLNARIRRLQLSN